MFFEELPELGWCDLWVQACGYPEQVEGIVSADRRLVCFIRVRAAGRVLPVGTG